MRMGATLKLPAAAGEAAARLSVHANIRRATQGAYRPELFTVKRLEGSVRDRHVDRVGIGARCHVLVGGIVRQLSEYVTVPESRVPYRRW